MSLCIYSLFDWNLIFFHFWLSFFIFSQPISWRETMLVFTNVTIWTMPFPTIFVLFSSFQKEFTDNFGSCSFHHLKLFFSQKFIEIIFWKLAHFFSSDCVHDQLSSLINIQIDFLSSVKSEIMWVNTFLSFLAKSLFEIRANFVGWIIIIWVITVLISESFGISIKCTKKSSLLLLGSFLFLFFIKFSFKHLSWLTLVFDSTCDTLYKT